MPTSFDNDLVSIFNRLNTLETHTACLNDCYNTLRQHFDYVPTNSEPSSWYPMVKSTIGGEIFMLVVILCLNFVLCQRMFMNFKSLEAF
jgi:hypothetical protein